MRRNAGRAAAATRLVAALLAPASDGVLLAQAAPARADGRPDRGAAPSRPLSARALRAQADSMRLAVSLDVWIVERYRGAQLLIDTIPTTGSIAADALWPRIETMRVGTRHDTLFAIHFAARPGEPSLGRTSAVRLAGPTGSVSPVAANVLARRPFRAPRVPGAHNNSERDWRYGWAYVAALPKAGSTTPATTFRGWLLIDASTPR